MMTKHTQEIFESMNHTGLHPQPEIVLSADPPGYRHPLKLGMRPQGVPRRIEQPAKGRVLGVPVENPTGTRFGTDHPEFVQRKWRLVPTVGDQLFP